MSVFYLSHACTGRYPVQARVVFLNELSITSCSNRIVLFQCPWPAVWTCWRPGFSLWPQSLETTIYTRIVDALSRLLNVNLRYLPFVKKHQIHIRASIKMYFNELKLTLILIFHFLNAQIFIMVKAYTVSRLPTLETMTTSPSSARLCPWRRETPSSSRHAPSAIWSW